MSASSLQQTHAGSVNYRWKYETTDISVSTTKVLIYTVPADVEWAEITYIGRSDTFTDGNFYIYWGEGPAVTYPAQFGYTNLNTNNNLGGIRGGATLSFFIYGGQSAYAERMDGAYGNGKLYFYVKEYLA